MIIFLTGATGYIGSAVAGALQQAGHSVIGLARSDEAAGQLHWRGIATHRGDLTDPASLRDAAAAADGVIHTGTTNNGEWDAAAVVAMLNAIAGSSKPFLYTSGIWVLGDTNGRVADETWPACPPAVVAWRPAAEQTVLEAARQDVRTSVLRPAVVYGRGGGIAAGFAKFAREHGAARYVGDGENRWPAIDVDDLADLYVRALEQAAPGTLLHASDGSAHRVKEIAKAASIGAGADGRTESWPLDEARKMLGALADALALDQQVSSQKARALLGWQPRAAGILDDLRQGSYTA